MWLRVDWEVVVDFFFFLNKVLSEFVFCLFNIVVFYIYSEVIMMIICLENYVVVMLLWLGVSVSYKTLERENIGGMSCIILLW